MQQSDRLTWDLTPAIDLLNALSFSSKTPDSLSCASSTAQPHYETDLVLSDPNEAPRRLGNFDSLWDFLGQSRDVEAVESSIPPPDFRDSENVPSDLDIGFLNKGVRWRDEVDGADLEDNVDPIPLNSASSLRTQKRAARRARARAKAEELAAIYEKERGGGSDTATGADSGEELEQLRRSPDRRAIIQNVLREADKGGRDYTSPPTSPSPPKHSTLALKKEWPVSDPFHWPVGHLGSPLHRHRIAPQDNLSPEGRKRHLISLLSQKFPDEKIYLSNSGLVDPLFSRLNVSDAGIHVFVDISNISIGFHDCLKVARQIPISTRIRRVPLCFHNFSLILERGRPAAKRVLVGSDKFPVVQQAKNIGYETNILERVHKAKELTPRQKKYSSGGGGGRSSGGLSSGSETNTMPAPEKWVEQAVDEILHLKILESLIDADRPSTIVLATGDAAEAEYSGGFMKMVERALEKGWMVELVSFRLNTSSAYRRPEFRSKWGPMFRWIMLDDYVEQLIDVED